MRSMKYLQKIKTEKGQLKVVFLTMCVLFAAVLIPLFWIGYYNFRSVDDFSYAMNSESIWKETHSVLKVLLGQIPYTWDYYQKWQGTFFSEWFTTSMMGIFSENAYYMSVWLTLGSFVLAEGFLLMTILCKVLGSDYYRAGIVTMSCIIIQVLLTPFPCEAFYWFCGAVLYTFIHALGLLLCTLWILLYLNEKTKQLKGVLLSVGIVLLTIAVAGSNYITALTILILYVLCTVLFFWKRHGKKWLILVCNILYLIAFAVNVLAPGNNARQNAAGVERMSAIKSILLSLKEAAVYVTTWTIFPCVVLGILLLPLFISIVRKKNFRYPLPALVSVISFGIFAAQFTPTIYALGIIGAGRVQNLYRFNYFLLLYGNELYWIGWCNRRYFQKELADSKAEEYDEAADHDGKKKRISWLLPGWLAGSLILIYGLNIWGGTTLTSLSAWRSLRRGEAEQYYAEYQERLKILEDETIEEVVLEPFSVKPYVLFFGDIVKDPGDWVNCSVAEYFGKKSVVLESQEGNSDAEH